MNSINSFINKRRVNLRPLVISDDENEDDDMKVPADEDSEASPLRK